MRFIYFGQTSFGNRGCEALVRSNTRIIREVDPKATFLCPSLDAELDRRQWLDAAAHGVSFAPVPPYPLPLKIWNRATKALPWVRRIAPPPVRLDLETRRTLETVDAVLMIGGDIISLDYGLFSLHFWTSLVDAARRLGKPVHLVAASVGPFSMDPVVERQMLAHLRGYTSITVRETASLNYLHSLGIAGATLVADPAFILPPEVWDVSALIREDREHVGLNMSPLVRAARGNEAAGRAFDAEVVAFIRDTVARGGDEVLLIPHVDPLKGGAANSDRAYMEGLMNRLDAATREHVRLAPDLMNAAQIKYLLGKCSTFIGARTHATIGAISQGVPTISIAYSVKALGINKDLFGSTKYVLPTTEVSASTLADALALLKADTSEIKSTLVRQLPAWLERARRGAVVVGQQGRRQIV